jgi:hypothetical protein
MTSLSFHSTCYSRHKMAAAAFNCHIASFVQPIFTLKSALKPERMISSQTLSALEKRMKSVWQICILGQFMPDFCTLGHFIVFLAACVFASCASNHLLRGQDMPFLWPFYAVSDTTTLNCIECGRMEIALPGAAYQRAPAICLVVALRRLKRLVVAIMRMTAARPCSS